MAAIILGVTAVALLNALAFPDSGGALSDQNPSIVFTSAAGPAHDLTSFAIKGVQSGKQQDTANSVSPFELARSINNVRRTKVDVSLKETWQKLGIEPGQFEDCSNDCEAKIFRHELSSNTGPEVVLKLTRFVDFCRYLIFGRAEGGRGWKFLGYVDHDFNKYEMARHRIATANGKSFFVVRGQEGSGSGFALYAETWYEVSDDGVKPVLSYPSDGRTSPWPAGLAREFKVTTIPGAARANQLTVQYTVTYDSEGYDGDELRLEFVNQHRQSYNWDATAGRFVLDPQQSNISPGEIAAIANIESDDEPKTGTKIGDTTFYSSSEAKSFLGGGYEVFLKYNLPRLTTIAKGRASRSKSWLKQFLTECRDTDEKQALLAALDK
jgi:hypothetical protein